MISKYDDGYKKLRQSSQTSRSGYYRLTYLKAHLYSTQQQNKSMCTFRR